MLGGPKTKNVKENKKTNLKTLWDENTKMIKIKKYKEMNIIKNTFISTYIYIYIYIEYLAKHSCEIDSCKETLTALSTQKELKGESESLGGIQAGNLNNEALHVIGFHGSGETKSLSSCRTGRWQRWHYVVAWPWTSCARKCTKWKGDVDGLGSERACWFHFLSNFVVVCTPCAFFCVNVGFQTCLGVCE